MANIHITTFIEAPPERVFDLCRSISVYKTVFNTRKESFISGASGNLLSPGETITIHAKHLGKTRTTTLKITDFEKARQLTLVQTSGDLASYKHQQHFKTAKNGTILIDIINVEKPRDFIGGIIAPLYLKSYIQKLAESRNALSKQYAEGEKWKMILTN
jgi:ligand-binding SRPBCC domain-containing protein